MITDICRFFLKNMIQLDVMSAQTPDIIYPCPFSKGYGIPSKQAWQLLYVYYAYRFILSFSFCILFYFRYGPSFLGSLDGNLFTYTSLAYLVLTLWLGFCLLFRWLSYGVLAQILIFTDIITLTLLMHASGGIGSGIGILIAVSVAAGGLLIGGRCAVVLAAIASMFILSAETYADHYDLTAKSRYTYTGMLGASYFAIALLSMVMAKRSEQMLVLADQQKITILRLEEFNQYIIQHLQSGLIIFDEAESVLMVNQAALRLTGLLSQPIKLIEFSSGISLEFRRWLNEHSQNLIPLTLDDNTEIQCRFMLMPTHQRDYFLAILEDITLYNQRLQQSKLASLGRLTASIAHEIRNPLGAISHAGQLLAENPELSSSDQRLTKIIQTNSIRVNQIIEDILNLSRRTDSVRQKINLNQWIDEYLENYYVENSSSISQFKLQIDEPLLHGLIDPSHLKQIMDNLCQNALRYGRPDKGDIMISAHNSPHGPCIEVIDHGDGIRPEHIKQLFEPFFTTSPSGTGLGLYLSRELAELNQAKLSYYLTEEGRSCFRLCLQDANETTIEI